jgi:hypothetical protein
MEIIEEIDKRVIFMPHLLLGVVSMGLTNTRTGPDRTGPPGACVVPAEQARESR